MQNVITYIESHLQDDMIQESAIISMVGCSFGFFQRVFSYFYQISFAEYIRYRKMTLAGYDVKDSSRKIIDISYQYGYQSPTSFTKAFKQFHGVSPKEARENNSTLKVFPIMQISNQQTFSFHLERKNAFRLIGKTYPLANDHIPQQQIPAIWVNAQKDGTFYTLVKLDEGQPKGLFAFCQNEYTYQIMVENQSDTLASLQEMLVPSHMWVVFDCYGAMPEAIQNGWHYLCEEWFHHQPFQMIEGLYFEWYSEGNTYDEHYKSQIWIPIKEE